MLKTMGIIAVLLFSQGQLGSDFYVPFWVVITCQAAMGLGTLVGGWRIVHTVGSKITRLTPVQGTCAATPGAIMLFAATYLGIPVSTRYPSYGRFLVRARLARAPPPISPGEVALHRVARGGFGDWPCCPSLPLSGRLGLGVGGISRATRARKAVKEDKHWTRISNPLS